MPEVIDLIDSTPPHPSQSLPPPSTQPRHLAVQHAVASSPNFLSDDFDSSLFTFEEPGHSTKKRRLSPPCESAPQIIRSSQNLASDYSLFTFSDDIDPPALPYVSRATSTNATAIATTSTNVDANVTADTGNQLSKTKTYTWNGEESDPIIFTSSAPERTTAKGRQETRVGKPSDNSRTKTASSVINLLDDADNIEDWSDPFHVLPEDALDRLLDDPRPALKPSYSERTAALLADLRNKGNDRPGTKTRTKREDFDIDQDDDDDDSPLDILKKPLEATSKTRRKPRANADEKAAKTKERDTTREQRKREKEAEKEAEKERKRIQKEEKAKEKQLAADIAEVNRSKTHKKESMPEMIVDLESTFNGTSVGNQVVEYIKTLGADHTFFKSTIPNVVRWRRRTKSTYNKDAARWEPCQPYISAEDHVLCMISAQEFVDMVIYDPLSSVTDNDAQTLDGHVQRLKSTFLKCKPIYLIEGLTAWLRKNQNSRNRAYQAEVLRQINDTNANTAGDDLANANSTVATQDKRQRGRKPKKLKKPEDTPPVADDTIEDALLQLQVTHNCLIYHTSTASETAEWIKNFSEHISTIPYRHVQMSNYDGAAFCMETGQVKTGEDKLDTFVKMLQEVNRVTAPMAYGIVNQYPSALDLLHAMKRRGPSILEDVRKSANKNGALTDSRIGPAVSKRLYKVFMELDEMSADI